MTAVGSASSSTSVEAVAGWVFWNIGKTVNVQGGGSGTGLSQVQSGAVDIELDVFCRGKDGIEDASRLWILKVAAGLASDWPDKEWLLKIDNGTTTQKSLQVVDQLERPGNFNHQPVGSGSERRLIRWLWMAKHAEPKAKDSNGMVKSIVSQTPGAISYLAFAHVDDSVKSMRLEWLWTNNWKCNDQQLAFVVLWTCAAVSQMSWHEFLNFVTLRWIPK